MDAYLAGCDVRDHLRDEIRIEFGTFISVLPIIHYFILKCFNTANTYTIYDTYAVFVLLFKVKTRIFHTLNGAYKGQLCTTIHLAGILTIDVFLNVKVLNLTTKLGFEISCIKLCKRSSTAFSLQKALPGFTCSIA